MRETVPVSFKSTYAYKPDAGHAAKDIVMDYLRDPDPSGFDKWIFALWI